LTVDFDPTVSFSELVARLGGVVVETQACQATGTSLDSILAGSVSILAAASGLGAGVQIASVLLNTAASPRAIVEFDPLDAIDALIALLRGDLASALLSVALILIGAALYAWLCERWAAGHAQGIPGRRLAQAA
jgi:hypothetical protein